MAQSKEIKTLDIGFDVGSTTIKAVVLSSQKEVLFSEYTRHHAKQATCLANLMKQVLASFPQTKFRVAITGSGGSELAGRLGVNYVQEVVANSVAIQELYGNVSTAIELGGQDAKMIFFSKDASTGKMVVSDMRMNGSCAGGTGAFIDEIANLLNIPIEEFNTYAEKGTTVYSISGRCGVFAKTDIQPLLNQGVSKYDLALSAFHAISKQTIGGLAQGLDINAPVIFEGGPLTFNPVLVRVFIERLGLKDEEALIPEHPETIVARGAALSLDTLLCEEHKIFDLASLVTVLENLDSSEYSQSDGKLYFSNEQEKNDFLVKYELPNQEGQFPASGAHVKCHLGIDSGSTTTKMVLLDENENLLWSYYSSNEGSPVETARKALLGLAAKAKDAKVEFDIVSAGTTGYGENLLAEAFGISYHTVETVAHETAARKYDKDASFILDIGGQDMKAIWVNDGIITNIVVNEACSSGCGSFLEGFAKTLNIPVQEIANAAFKSEHPADLGSRCTVFMNSSIVTAQRMGKGPNDIMAGLCRSIIENVFTKVIRVSNLSNLGSHIVVQGGTFINNAVLRAFEQYVGHTVTRAPYPGLMGAIGVALLAAKAHEQDTQIAVPCAGEGAAGNDRIQNKASEQDETTPQKPAFIGFDALENLSFTQESGVLCNRCMNQCSRTIIRFSTGAVFVTGNRCERGAELEGRRASAQKQARKDLRKYGNIFGKREKLLFKDWPISKTPASRSYTIGLPRVLFYWENAPFWKTFFRALGFDVVFSGESTREMYENGLSAVCSDTVCFPAKLVHGHVRDLANKKVDCIFMPTVTTVESETAESTSISMCAVVKGYGMVIRNSDNPQTRFGVRYENPLFHWFTHEDKCNQLAGYMQDAFGVSKEDTFAAIQDADAAQKSFKAELEELGTQALAAVKEAGSFAIVLGGRPYHNDRLVNHDLPRMFFDLGVIALPADAIAGVNEVDLSNCLIDIVNNYHARMLGAAVIAAQSDYLEFAQVVSFGCGHDAYLTDEIIRVMKELGNKPPLVMKVDESDAHGPLAIRVRSFIETVKNRKKAESSLREDGLRADGLHVDCLRVDDSCENLEQNDCMHDCKACEFAAQIQTQNSQSKNKKLKDPYPVKFTKADRAIKTVLVPNTSHAFSMLMSAAFAAQGLRTVSLPVGREEAIRLGKKYVHNDICFPAQIVIGEALAELETGKYDPDTVAVATGKYIGDCRLTHYAALLRKALDDAGYEQVPIVTNDDVDFHNIHPGFKMNIISALRVMMGLPMIDAMEDLLRKIRPYELHAGDADAAFERGIKLMMDGLQYKGVRGLKRGFEQAIELMKQVEYDRSNPRPTVLIVGEYLLNFHPGANHEIERLLEKNGMEIIEAKMTDVIRKTYFYQHATIKEYKVHRPLKDKIWYTIADNLFEYAHKVTEQIAAAHPLYEPAIHMPDLVKDSDPIIHHTFDAGEGVLIPGEILHNAKHGCKAFVILQPFGCLPNHVVGRGIAKKLKEYCPDAQILPLDFDPDVSFANIENRLQMMVMNIKANEQI